MQTGNTETDQGINRDRNPCSREVTIIIPIGPNDQSWRVLLQDLRFAPFDAEIICVATIENPESPTLVPHGERTANPMPVYWIVSARGRARQMNLGAARAAGRFLWFLHADSRLDPNALDALKRSWIANPSALHYFNLAFQSDGPRWMSLNAWGVWIRSHWMGMPFGDQGLCLKRDLFELTGGYSETARYGEDHLLVWKARRCGIPLRCTGATLPTSARKYRERGWLRTTCLHVCLTFRQAAPQFWLWLLGK